MATVAVLGTCDTKLDELLFLREAVIHRGVAALLIDVGRNNVQHEAIAISHDELVQRHGDQDPVELPRGELIKFMSTCALAMVKELFDDGKVHGIIAAGGSGGTSLASAVMRDLPIGFPKLIVSTVASGETGPIVGETDITLMYSVVDVAGLNELLRDILTNAGAAIASMASVYAGRRHQEAKVRKKRVAITMFGVTTPGVDAIRRHLASSSIETYVFHATGHGGMAMERLISEGRLDAVIDLTTTEICDFITGGVMSAGGERLEAAAQAGIPNIVSVGATDMTNFGPKLTVPEKYQQRQLYEHNPVVTLMRSSVEESTQVGDFIAAKLRNAKNPAMVQVRLPRGGVSMISATRGPFCDVVADEALFTAIHEGLAGSGIEVVDDARDINDDGFAADTARALLLKLGLTSE
jgi:uncharacterized protein (UPF0261 family)